VSDEVWRQFQLAARSNPPDFRQEFDYRVIVYQHLVGLGLIESSANLAEINSKDLASWMIKSECSIERPMKKKEIRRYLISAAQKLAGFKTANAPAPPQPVTPKPPARTILKRTFTGGSKPVLD